MEDLKVSFKNVADESIVNRDSTVTKYKRYDFYIGKHGPFVERVQVDEFTDQAIALRVQALKTHLQTLPQ